MSKCIILANGSHPGRSVFDFLRKSGYCTLICADGGANSAYRLDITPDYIIGDFDSLEDKVKKYYTGKSEIIKISRQNDTDVEKCLKFAVKKKFNEAILLGATGDRLDHSFCNLGIVLKFFDRIKIKIIHQKSLLAAYEKGEVSLSTIPDEVVSIYGISDKTKITSSGLKYPLKNTALPFGVRESTSNVAVGEEVRLKISEGKIFVIRDLQTLRKNGLIQHT